MMVQKLQLFFLLPFLFVRTASAKDVDLKDDEARTACLAGDYAKGVAILSELFVQTKDAAFIYNQGRCFEQNRRYEDAISRFEEFLRVAKKASKADRAQAHQHIAECRRSLDRQRPSAPAPEKSGTEDKVRAARKACLTGDPTTGVALLTDLYLDTKDPNHLFNQGRCFEQNQRYRDAIGRFREHLEKAKDLSAEEKADTQRHIATCESYLQQEPTTAPGSAPPSVAAERPTEKPTEKPTIVATEPQPAGPGSPMGPVGREGRGLRVAGGVVASVGMAGLLTGLILNLKVNGMSSDLEADWNTGKNSTRQSYKSAAWAAYGAGAGCVVVGSVLYYLGWRRGEDAASIALVPTVGPDMAGALVAGGF